MITDFEDALTVNIEAILKSLLLPQKRPGTKVQRYAKIMLVKISPL